MFSHYVDVYIHIYASNIDNLYALAAMYYH